MLDIFVLDENFQKGTILNGIENIVWTERYRESSDFKIVSSEISKFLTEIPLGSYLSHNKTQEIMVVEDREIVKNLDGNNTITFTGRSIEAVALGSRITLPNKNPSRTSRVLDAPNEYILSPNSSWHQAVSIIVDQFIDTKNFWADNAETKISCYTTIDGIEPQRAARVIKPANLYDEVLELLKISDCGIMSKRPENSYSTLDFVIHRGIDRSSTIIFSTLLENLTEVSYFSSTRNEKNAAFARSKFAGKWYVVNDTNAYPPTGNPKGLDIKWSYVDASSVDNDETISPQDYDLMVEIKAREAVSINKKIVITQAKVSENSKFVYNKDYFIGDIVQIYGDYGIKQNMRVVEFSWSIDGTKTSSYPSLSPVEPI